MKLTREYKIISVDESDNCMNSARLNKDNTVTIETYYRYGKPNYKTLSLKEFNHKLKNEEI